jgi:hypothetical protein
MDQIDKGHVPLKKVQIFSVGCDNEFLYSILAEIHKLFGDILVFDRPLNLIPILAPNEQIARRVFLFHQCSSFVLKRIFIRD